LHHALLKYDELVATGRAALFSPHDLKHRVMLKGKVRSDALKRGNSRKWARQASGVLRTASRTSLRTSLTSARCSSLLYAVSSRLAGPSKRESERKSSVGSDERNRVRKSSVRSEGRKSSVRSDDDDADVASIQNTRLPSLQALPGSSVITDPGLSKCDRLETIEKARGVLYGGDSSQPNSESNSGSRSLATDIFYSQHVAIRSVPFHAFLEGGPQQKSELPVLPISSANEDRFLRALGLTKEETQKIEGLLPSSSNRFDSGQNDERLPGVSAIFCLAANPPRLLGAMQRRTTTWLLRPYPLGLRISGANMSPIPFWLAGAQSVALNMSNSDLPVRLHFALFNGTEGYLLKPPDMLLAAANHDNPFTASSSQLDVVDKEWLTEDVSVPTSPKNVLKRTETATSCESSCSELEMRTTEGDVAASAEPMQRSSSEVRKLQEQVGLGRIAQQRQNEVDVEAMLDRYWPAPCASLQRTTIRVLSLHHLPTRGEQRPRYDGAHAACHDYHPELSGAAAPPNGLGASSPKVHLALHQIGGFCAVTNTLPVDEIRAEYSTRTARDNGLNARYGDTAHFIAAEPHATFLYVGVTDEAYGREEAFCSAVLGRLKCGYRVFMLRSQLGTRIELCFLLVHISKGHVSNHWQTQRQLRAELSRLREGERVQAAARRRSTRLQQEAFLSI